MQEYFIDILKNKYADFNGRARRREYWMFVLYVSVVGMVLSVLFGIFQNNFLGTIFSFLSAALSLAIFIPSLALCVRRLHDIGKSGGWVFISFVPIVGGIWLLVLLATDSQQGENQYGAYPK